MDEKLAVGNKALPRKAIWNTACLKDFAIAVLFPHLNPVRLFETLPRPQA
jgi:hypothetical protein